MLVFSGRNCRLHPDLSPTALTAAIAGADATKADFRLLQPSAPAPSAPSRLDGNGINCGVHNGLMNL